MENDKDRAILNQDISFLLQQLREAEAREHNIKSMYAALKEALDDQELRESVFYCNITFIVAKRVGIATQIII